MPSSPFIALEAVDGVVRRVEGQVSSGGVFGGDLNLWGKNITEALNMCAKAGYEHFDTDVYADKKIYRLKLRIQ